MTEIKLNVLFKKIQKDDKKEVLLFHVQGELTHAEELSQMPGTIALLNVEESEAGEIGAEFVNFQRDDKKAVLKFHIKRDVEGKVTKLYPHGGTNVSLILKPSQMSIEEFYEEHEGIDYKVDNDGSVIVDSNQMSLDEV